MNDPCGCATPHASNILQLHSVHAKCLPITNYRLYLSIDLVELHTRPPFHPTRPQTTATQKETGRAEP